MEAKRADYFEAGTLVVWDVDPRAEQARVYRSQAPDLAEVFRRGQDVERRTGRPRLVGRGRLDFRMIGFEDVGSGLASGIEHAL